MHLPNRPHNRTQITELVIQNIFTICFQNHSIIEVFHINSKNQLVYCMTQWLADWFCINTEHGCHWVPFIDIFV